MADTSRHVRDMAESMRLGLTEQELAKIVAIVKETGSFAPEAEVVEEFRLGTLTSGTMTFFLPSMWRYREGDSRVPTDVWRMMFQRAQYTEDMTVQPRPKKSVRAYRGSTKTNREGLSWSLDAAQAEYFARSRQAPGVTTAHVWVTNIPAERMFARYMDGWENEIAADVRGLDIRPVAEAHLLSKPHWWQIWHR